MTPASLVDALVERARKALADYLLPAADGQEPRAPSVYAFDLPEKKYMKTKDEADFPVVCVFVPSGADRADDDGVCTALFLVGAYDSSVDRLGARIVLDILARLRLDLLTKRLEGQFELLYPVAWEIPREQPLPQWVGTLTTSWRVPVPQNTAPIPDYN